jgi:dihydroorotate dehydrogenase
MRSWLWRLAKWVLFRFDPEAVHRVSIALMKLGRRGGAIPLRIASGASKPAPEDPGAARVLGTRFSSRLGLAAGFDKDAELLESLPYLGFGFAEIGTVTPRPQPGNDRPRLFRQPARSAIFNRMGFNGLGAEIVSRNLAEARPKLPEGFRVGVNLGKNKDTPAEEASSDYVRACRAFEGLSDYLVINVSSPNTPGLRALQTVEALQPIVEGVVSVVEGWKKRVPVLLKLAPELFSATQRVSLDGFFPRLESWGVSGWVLTNTLAGEIELSDGRKLPGGWSGGPVASPATDALAFARPLTKLPIISVGGILSGTDARARLALGADLLQVYTGWIYGGPSFPARISREISEKQRP